MAVYGRDTEDIYELIAKRAQIEPPARSLRSTGAL